MRPLATWLAVVLLAYPLLCCVALRRRGPKTLVAPSVDDAGVPYAVEELREKQSFHDGVGWCRQDLRQLLPALLFTLGQVMLVLQATWMFRCPFPFGPPF